MVESRNIVCRKIIRLDGLLKFVSCFNVILIVIIVCFGEAVSILTECSISNAHLHFRLFLPVFTSMRSLAHLIGDESVRWTRQFASVPKLSISSACPVLVR
jgi:hypothetical protein